MGRPRTAVFLCNCGPNIAGAIDLDIIAGQLASRQDVAVVERHALLCSPDGQQFFRDTLQNRQVDNVVVVACSPKMHEKTFQDLAGEAGINIGHVQMANVREHCAWVTPDKATATAKAQLLINAAIRRSLISENLEQRSMEVNTDVLVIGGGLAGIEAALTAAAAGRKVTIVDREISLGGAVIKTEEVAPSLECAPCLLAPRLAAVRDNSNITVLTRAEVTEVRGFYGNFTVRVRRQARAIEPSCIGCEACFEVCPVTVPSRFHLGLGTHKAVYTLFPGSVPAAAAIDKSACRHFTDGTCNACVEACPFGAVNFDQPDDESEFAVGAIVVATGFSSWDPRSISALGYGTVPDVYTLPEFERLASSNGPTHSEIRLRDGRAPRSVAVVHCAGSLRPDAIPYCSRVCCLGALKVGELVRKQIPGATVTNIHHDLVLTTPREQAFYRRQAHEGTRFLACTDLAAVQVRTGDHGIRVEGPGFEPVEVDMVVLATGLQPAAGTRELAGLLNVELDADGFLKPDHAVLHCTGASLDGIYVAGCAAGPCDLPTAVTQGQAAVGDAISKLMPGRRINLEMMTSVIDADLCAGCRLCKAACPYKAVSFDRERKVCVVNEAICRGCGTCSAACPTGASKARHFTDAQIHAEIGGLLHG
ncbi:MAG: hypothetical protein A3K19_22200 [Lentisphaerae bacterium RIFOXYB12_FULL_65_16]|nr:MAG: hypothetical protein A3K18_21370 [Lentisphaerae bacterium RIFOXYA12_64_32]OGV93574.1 MAG: hypothetical protein A3K19_22200 [Lentisphaerae bacterium RIFOXYB12_FULL_65_16]